MTNVQLENLFAKKDTSVALAIHSCSLSVVHHMLSLNIDTKMIRPDFVGELQRGESWENISLEFHRFSVNCVQSSVLW